MVVNSTIRLCHRVEDTILTFKSQNVWAFIFKQFQVDVQHCAESPKADIFKVTIPPDKAQTNHNTSTPILEEIQVMADHPF